MFIRTLIVALSVAGGAALLPQHQQVAPVALKTLVIDGRGYGHGRGMSQWGARGMAEAGKPWRAILAHYYRGTTVSRRAPGERIRVLIRSGESIVVGSSGRYEVRWNDGRSAGVSDAKRRYMRVRRAGGHYVVEQSRSPSGPWQGRTRSRRHVVFVRGKAPLEVFAGTTSRLYRGTIEVRGGVQGRVEAINHLPIEEYLMGVVPRETPASWAVQALRAQAVAARSYATALKDRARKKTYDICATTACQVYGGYGSRATPSSKAAPSERERTTAAVMSTQRTVLTYRGRPIIAEYSSSSGGMTASGKDRPYLSAVPDPADRISPYHTWRRRIDGEQIGRAFPGLGRVVSVSVRSRDGAGTWGGRVRTVRIVGSRRRVDIPGGTFASRLSLRSRWYTFAAPAAFVFTPTFGPGSKGAHVAALQRRLTALQLFRATITGYYGPSTRDAVRAYQRRYKIRATGNVGPATAARLNATY